MDIEKINENSIRRFYGAHRPKPIGTHRFFSVLVPFVEKNSKMIANSALASKNTKECIPRI